MGRVSFCFFLIGAILLAAMARHVQIYQKRRIYPPRKLVRQRIAFFGGAGIVCFLLAVLLLLF